MTRRPLLLTFCNQLTSPQHAGGVLDRDSDGYRWLPIAQLEIPNSDMGGLTGACRVGEDLVLTTQSTPPLILLYDPVTDYIKSHRDLSPCVDPHSVAYHDGALYVVSTGTNEIYEVPLVDGAFGEPRVYWRHPGVEYDRDLIHLNGLTVSTEGFIASCFGPRQADGSWGNEGAVLRLEPYLVIQGGLSQPHTPLRSGRMLFFAESRANRAHVLHLGEDGTWSAQPPIEVGGYARGLAYQDGRLWVGVSAPRRISRSKGTANLGIDATQGAAVVCIDLTTRTVTDRWPLGAFGEEVYDLLILDQAGPLGSLVDALAQRITGVQARMDEFRAAWVAASEMLEPALQKKRNVQLLLQQERNQNQRLVQQLRAIGGSRIWRAAQLFRRLVGRPAYPLEVGRQSSPAVVPTGQSMADIFHAIFAHNAWGSEDSRSGTGSDLTQTAVVRAALPELLRELNARTMLDVPCGDFHWMKMVDLPVDYIGADVVADIVEANTASHANPHRRFLLVDVVSEDLPQVDLIFCRDLLVHFSFADALRAITNLKDSRSTYLLTTTFTNRTINVDIETGQWRPLNLQIHPFNFPPPLRLLNENCTEWGTDWADKSLALWRLADLPTLPAAVPSPRRP